MPLVERALSAPEFNEPEWLSPKQAGRILQLSAKTVRLLCRNGTFGGARKMGRQWRVPCAEVEAATPGGTAALLDGDDR